MNTKYGKINATGGIEYAPSSLRTAHGLSFNPSEADYLAAGWKPINENQPPKRPGYYWVPLGWADDGNIIKRTFEERKIEPTPKRYNKNALADSIVDSGKFSELNALFAKNPILLFRWNSALEFVDDDKNFIQFRSLLVAEFGEETVAAILERAEV